MLVLLSFAVWLFLVFAHGRFWDAGPETAAAMPAACPDVDIIVPARDESATIGAAIASLLAQDYGGRFAVILVDDDSSDGTAAAAGSAPALRIIRGAPKPDGWSGKLWALHQGVMAGSAPLLLFTDADITHDPRHLASLMARLERRQVGMASEMVRLHCSSFAERALIPAFVYFFQMLYPFAKVNDPRSAVAAAAGGTVLIRRETLERSGGIAAIRAALIDDVTLAASVKRVAPIDLSHSRLAASIRPYPQVINVWRMITRTAFTQLRYSPLLLALTVAGLALIWLVPVWAILFDRGWRCALGCGAFSLAAASFLPTLHRYERSPAWALALPLIASFYLCATIVSALNHWFGSGALWKNRTYERKRT
jgi:hopene-associated glycosyltransferase HpnB